MVAHAAVAIALTSIASSSSACLAGFENRRARLGNARAVADTVKRSSGGNVDSGKWRQNQNVSAGTLSLASPPLLSCVEQTGGSASAFLEEQEVVMSSGMKEIEEKLKLLLTVQTKLEESVTPPSRQKQESSGKDDFYVNCGAAIRNLREELPALFYKDLNYDIYREDITFSDPMNTFSGIENYKTLFWALRFHGRIFFKALWVEIVRVWQPSEKVIMVRWIVRGIPRVPWEAQGRFDGTSEYKLDKDGKIYSHKVDNIIMNSPPKHQTRSVMDLVRAAAGQGTPTPTYYQKVGVFSFLKQFTWVRFYLALRSTLAVTSSSEAIDVLPNASLNP
ncbi:uncharacterized protein [Physcomitrium patens]|uniref:SnoaL-like domain-containing protein n=1 Tax=Physcomitrium patens TaxID=3218 RepID=A0A2K1L6Q3_PHYPA|nr:uncharacterized protein LOC112288400 [Physcomitrium patens]PNR61713.1 hypothetical protein PHYPA_000136 [Physcomitrium patens]|eukprot:XP_024388294.1 uncharacterized protein LOC112288400 [Physcomitrella patens]